MSADRFDEIGGLSFPQASLPSWCHFSAAFKCVSALVVVGMTASSTFSGWIMSLVGVGTANSVHGLLAAGMLLKVPWGAKYTVFWGLQSCHQAHGVSGRPFLTSVDMVVERNGAGLTDVQTHV